MSGAGREASCPAALPAGRASDFRLLRDLESVVDLNAEIPHGAFELRVAKQQLHGSQVPGSPVDECRLGTPDRVRPVRGRIKADLLNPAVQNASILPRAKVRRPMQSAREEVVIRPQRRRPDPCLNRLSS